MTTTTLFVDLLIIGIQVSIWLVLLILSIFGYKWIDTDFIIKNQTIIAIMLVSIVYPLGIFIDNLIDRMLKNLRKRIRRRKKISDSYTLLELSLDMKNEMLYKYFDYIRIRTRISRSSFVNFIAITFALNRCIHTNLTFLPKSVFNKFLLWEEIFGFVLVVLAGYSWYELSMNEADKISQLKLDRDLD